MVVFYSLGVGIAAWEVAVASTFRWEVLVFAAWCFGLPDAARGKEGPLVGILRGLAGNK